MTFDECPKLPSLSGAALLLFLGLSAAPYAGGQVSMPAPGPIVLSEDGIAVSQVVQTPIELPATVKPSAPAVRESLVRSAAGPWGQLEYYPVFLEASSTLIDRFPLPNPRTRWVFPISMRKGLADQLLAAGLDQPFIDTLTSPSSMVTDNDWIYVFPPLNMLEAMTQPQRQAVYGILRHFPINEYYYEPVVVTSGNVDEWFRTSKLRPELIAKFKQFTYMRGEALVFSDLPALLNYSTGESEGKAMLKAFTRTRALVARLILSDTTDLESLMAYWTTGLNLRRKDVEPLLQSIIDTQGIDNVDIVHLLPALPRKLCMTYPDAAMAKDGIFPDCHWTSLNFFNYDAQPYLLDSRLATSAVLERFNPVEGPYKFGDILFFLDNKQGDAFHSCVYIADDIVFTKNGRNVLSPWIMAKLEDVKKVYLFDNNGHIQGYRTKSAPASGRSGS